MKTTLKKIASLLICLCLIISGMAITASAADTQITFDFGANGKVEHYDGSAITNTSLTSNGYTLTITNHSKCYSGARDAKGNSALKLGASSAAGKFTITAPNDVTSVIFNAAKYKSNTSKIKVNGTAYTLTKNSDDGAYDVITVDTTTNKTVTFETVTGGYRCMIDSIIYVIADTSGGDEGGEEPPVTPDPEEPGQGGGETPDPTPDPEEPGQGGGETPEPEPDVPTLTGASYVKVTEAPADWSGKYLIVYETDKKVFNGGLGTLDAGGNNIVLSSDITNGTISATSDLENAYFTIEPNGSKFGIKSASGKYIGQTTYANGLKTGTSQTETGYANDISFNSNGTVSISVELSGSTVYLKFNDAAGDNNNRFRYYKNGQKDICLYKYEEAKTPDPEEPPVTPEPEEPKTEIKGTNVEVGSDLTANYVVTVKPEDIEGKTLEMKFTMNGVSDSVVCDPAEIVDGTFTFAFEGIGAQCMSDTITASLVSKDSDGRETVHSTVEYRIKSYAQELLNDTNSSKELRTFVSDMLRYGDAAQTYCDYNLDNLATAGIKNLEPAKEDNLPTEASKMYLETKTENPVGDVYFKSATVRFSNINALVIKLNAVTENTKLYVNDKLVELDGATFVTDGVYADKYADPFTFKLYEGDELIQTLVYSINAYTYAMKDSSNTDMASLACALYAYGASASDYAAYISRS